MQRYNQNIRCESQGTHYQTRPRRDTTGRQERTDCSRRTTPPPQGYARNEYCSTNASKDSPALAGYASRTMLSESGNGLALREIQARFEKDKLVALLRRVGGKVSMSMAGRILSYLKAKGRLREAPGPGIPTRRQRRQRPYAVRKPREYQAINPGDIVQIDTLDVRPLPGVILKHFTARDVVSRWDVLSVHTRATAAMATKFLDTLQARLPFPIKAIQSLPRT